MNIPKQEHSQDHDMIVSLNVKVDRLISDVADIKNDTAVRIAKIESRLEDMDRYHAAIDLSHFQKNSAWVDDLRANWKMIIFIGSFLLSLLQTGIAILLRRYVGL